MTVFSWNINGFHTCNKYGGFDAILREAPDFICLQEVKIGNPDEMCSFFTMQYEHYYNFASNRGHNGVSIYAKNRAKNCTTNIGLPRFDSEGRFLSLEFEPFYLINIYMPHGGRDKKNLEYKMESYQFLSAFLSKLEKKEVILVGDFNIAPSPLDVERYRVNTDNIMFTVQEREALGALLQSGYHDIYREQNPDRRAYTWWPYAYGARGRNVGWRIDYALVTTALKEQVQAIEIRKEILGSDHCPIKLDINI